MPMQVCTPVSFKITPPTDANPLMESLHAFDGENWALSIAGLTFYKRAFLFVMDQLSTWFLPGEIPSPSRSTANAHSLINQPPGFDELTQELSIPVFRSFSRVLAVGQIYNGVSAPNHINVIQREMRIRLWKKHQISKAPTRNYRFQL